MIWSPGLQIWTPPAPRMPPPRVILPDEQQCPGRDPFVRVDEWPRRQSAMPYIDSHRFGAPATPLGGLDLTGMVGYWKLEEASGTRVDSHDSNDLDIDGAAGNTDGIIGNALDVTNTARYVGRADNAALSMGDIDFSLWGWFYCTAGVAGAVVGKCAAAPNIEYKVDASSWPNLRFLVSRNGTNANSVTLSSSLSTDAWIFFCARHDAANNFLRLRVNTTDATAVSYALGVVDAGAEFRIGKTQLDGASITGIIDEVGLIKRHLSDAEVTSLYNGGAGVTY